MKSSMNHEIKNILSAMVNNLTKNIVAQALLIHYLSYDEHFFFELIENSTKKEKKIEKNIFL